MPEKNMALAGDELIGSLRDCLDPSETHWFDSFVSEYRPVIRWLLKNNTGPHIGPASYQNTRHLVGVAFLTCWLTENHRPTVFAAFIHDFHYANQSPDGLNITRSLLAAEKHGYLDLPAVRAESRETILAAVEATEYDFANPFPTTNNERHRAIRDADQLYSIVFFDPDVYHGLEHEVGPKVNVAGVDFLIRNANYVAQNRFYTERARKLFGQYLSRCLLQHVGLVTLYTSSSKEDEHPELSEGGLNLRDKQPDAIPNTDGVSTPTTPSGRRTYQVWAEGYRATGEHGTATFHGEIEASSFEEACRMLLKGNEYFDAIRLSYWGCRLFDNETDARKTYG